MSGTLKTRLSRFGNKTWDDKKRALKASIRAALPLSGDPYHRHRGKPGALEVDFRGCRMMIEHRGTASDLGVIAQCFLRCQYEIPNLRAGYRERLDEYYNEILASGRIPLIVDCGANIGASALWYRARFPASYIIAIEPARDNVELLQRNVSKLDIDVRACALGLTDGEIALVDPGSGACAYRTLDKDDSGYRVPVVSLSSLLKGMQISDLTPFILKLDIEGAEKNIFDGNTSAFQKFPLIAIETHDWCFPGERTASGFFIFHGEAGRDFAFGFENVFSIDYNRLVTESMSNRDEHA